MSTFRMREGKWEPADDRPFIARCICDFCGARSTAAHGKTPLRASQLAMRGASVLDWTFQNEVVFCPKCVRLNVTV